MEKANVPLRQRGDRYADFVCCANHRRMASVSTVPQLGQIFLNSAKIPLFSSHECANFKFCIIINIWGVGFEFRLGLFGVGLVMNMPSYLQDVSYVFMRL